MKSSPHPRGTDWQIVRELQAMDDDQVTDLAAELKLFAPAPLFYLRDGISIFPLRADGTKRPAVETWKPYQTRLPYFDEIIDWFRQPKGISCICGRVSRGLQCLDFDDHQTYLDWSEIPEVREVLNWCIVVESPRRPLCGYHVIFRCIEVGKAATLASHPNPDKGGGVEAIVEFKGERTTFNGVGSAAATHKSGFPYMQVQGPVFPGETPVISPAGREILISHAMKFDQLGKVEKQAREIVKRQRWEANPTEPDDDAPWNLYNATDAWEPLLESHGFQRIRGKEWRKKDSGKKFADLWRGKAGLRYLTVYAANSPLNTSDRDRTTHSLFSAYSILAHGGDKSQAAKELIREGYCA